MTKVNVMPRDVRPGDRIDQMAQGSLDIVQRVVTKVEKVRMANRTAYRIFPEGGPDFVLNPGHPIEVEREEEGL